MAATDQRAQSGVDANASALYVYGVTRAAATPGASGDHDATLDAVAFRDLAAITSPVPAETVKARREYLLRHADVLQAAMSVGTVLPLRFGTVFADRESVVDDLLAPRYDELMDLLRSLDGHVELSVRAFYDEEAVLAEVVREDPRIARLRDASRAAPGFEALQMQLGEAVAAGLAAKRARDADEIIAFLLAGAEDTYVEEQRAEIEVLRGAFLVRQERVPDFDERMQRLSREHEARIRFKYTGPLPPHSFVSSLSSRSRG